jgi:hypothetical protein
MSLIRGVAWVLALGLAVGYRLARRSRVRLGPVQDDDEPWFVG